MTGNGDMFLHTDYMFKDEMEDERVNLLLDRIMNKFDWSNTEWPVIEPEETGMEEADAQNKGEQADKSVDDTAVAADVETSTVNVPGKRTRKIHDEGAETRKKKLLCKRLAEKKQSIDRETKSFIEGLIHSSVTSMGDMLSIQMSNMERMLTERMGKMESEVSQLRDAIRLSGERAQTNKSEAEQDLLNSKGDQAPPKSRGDQAPSQSRGDQAPSQSKDEEAPPKSKGGRPLTTGTKKVRPKRKCRI